MDLYMDQLYGAWTHLSKPMLTDIPVAKAELQGRIAGDGSFDGGHTASWLASLVNPTWRAVRCAVSGHTIHVVSDRPFDSLTADLRFGLRLLRFMSVRPVTWFWWDQPWVRELPASVDPGRDHLNGGWAIPGVLEVHVYRREEAHKVMLHEAIHALGLDVPHEAIEPVRPQFEAVLGRSLWPHLGEAFTELFAEVLWSVVSATSRKDAIRKWNYQVTCSERQAGVVWARIHDATVNENTNVFAYYVLKWTLMQHLTESLIGPDHSVGKWFAWWQEALPRLNKLALRYAATEHRQVSLAMTCPHGLSSSV
jgi:hypothetical protein